MNNKLPRKLHTKTRKVNKKKPLALAKAPINSCSVREFEWINGNSKASK